MIKSVTIRNFKGIHEEMYDFTDFDLLVGRNNSGKSTVLQAIAIWQFCVDEFSESKRKRTGVYGIQIVLPNFTALPVPEFNLLWREKTDRIYQNGEGGKRKPEYVLIEIDMTWINVTGKVQHFGVALRYQSPQTIYAIPLGGWEKFNELENNLLFPKIVYVPPFSGLEPSEQWKDDGILRQQVGKGQPGSILRNLLYRIIDDSDTPVVGGLSEWQTIERKIQEWFDINLIKPDYIKGRSIHINCRFKTRSGKDYDIIAAGSGFHQVLTLLAFLHGYQPTTILFDEPDAHLHTNLQYEIVNYLKTHRRNVQVIIATHSEALIKSLEVQSIISVLSGKPKRASSSHDVMTALADVYNEAVVKTQESPFILYVEGEDDARIIQAWTAVLKKESILNKFHILPMGGGSKAEMKTFADNHFKGLRQIVHNVKRGILLDYDSEDTFHPLEENPAYYEWKRKNIDNYLICSPAWKRAILDVQNKLSPNEDDHTAQQFIEDFFANENLTLPPNANWRNVKARVFIDLDGKKLLYESSNALFQQLNEKFGLKINRSRVAANFEAEEIHEDVIAFFDKLDQIANTK